MTIWVRSQRCKVLQHQQPWSWPYGLGHRGAAGFAASTAMVMTIWVRSQRCSCLVTWFCYQMIAKPGNKTVVHLWPGGCFKNTYELLNLRALNLSHVNKKSTSFNVWVRYFVWNFKGTLWNSTQNILSIHWKILFLYNIEILRALRFKSSYSFLKHSPDPYSPVVLNGRAFLSLVHTEKWASGHTCPWPRITSSEYRRLTKLINMCFIYMVVLLTARGIPTISVPLEFPLVPQRRSHNKLTCPSGQTCP